MYFLTESVVNRDTCRHGSDVAGETMSFARVPWKHIVEDTAKATTNHVGDRARTREFSRQDHLDEHVQRHHRHRKKEGAREVSGERE